MDSLIDASETTRLALFTYIYIAFSRSANAKDILVKQEQHQVLWSRRKLSIILNFIEPWSNCSPVYTTSYTISKHKKTPLWKPLSDLLYQKTKAKLQSRLLVQASYLSVSILRSIHRLKSFSSSNMEEKELVIQPLHPTTCRTNDPALDLKNSLRVLLLIMRELEPYNLRRNRK